MRLVIAASGSQGDTRPFVALAAGLRARGHDTVVCLDRCGRETAADLDVPFRELEGDFRSQIENGRGRTALERRDGGLTGLRLFRDLAVRHTEQWVDVITDAAAEHRADVVVGSAVAVFAAITAAEVVGARPAVAAAFPLSPTGAFASPVLPGPVPRPLNRVSHHVTARTLWTVFRGPTLRARRRRGLPAPQAPWGRMPALYGFSPALLEAPADWGSDAAVCGDWHIDDPRWEPPEDLVAFLDAGEPPVYVGFGSMASAGTAEFVRTVLAALRGHRVVLAPGWSGIGADLGRLPESVHVVGAVPHSWLLPRCAMAFHHCGAGTTHAVARAGIPSVPVPFVVDQPFWARRLVERGIATEPLDRRSASVADVAAAVAQAEGGQMRRRARAVADLMAIEDPIAPVVAHLSTWRVGAGE